MKDIKVGHLKPIGQPVSPNKGARKAPAGSTSFSQTLEHAVTQMKEVRPVDSAPVAKDAVALRKQLDEASANLAKMNQVEQQLRELHQKVTQPSKDNN